MIVTVTLDVIGTDTTTFSIYQDSGSFSTPLATGITSASLAAGYELAGVSEESTTLRILDEGGACGFYKDIPIGTGDTTPGVTLLNTLTPAPVMTGYTARIAGNGDNDILYYYLNTGFSPACRGAFSTDNGQTFSSIAAVSLEIRGVVYDGSNFYVTTANQLYRVTNYTSGLDAATYTAISTTGYPSAASDLFYVNNKFYVKGSDGLYRSSNGIKFSRVINNIGGDVVYTLNNYGNDLYLTSTGGFYRSTDDGFNWTELQTTGVTQSISKAYSVRAYGVDTIAFSSGSSAFYSTDNGTTLVPSNLVDGKVYNFIKHNSVIFYNTITKLYYTPDLTAGTPSETVVYTEPSYYYTSLSNKSIINRNVLFTINDNGDVRSFRIDNT